MVGHVITHHLDQLPYPIEVGEKCCPPKRPSVSVVLELQWYEYMCFLLSAIEEVSCHDHHPEGDCL